MNNYYHRRNFKRASSGRKDISNFSPLKHSHVHLLKGPAGSYKAAAKAAARIHPDVMAPDGTGRPPIQNFLNNFESDISWVWQYITNRFWFRHDFLDESKAPNGTSRYKMLDNTSISIAADWGTGTNEAYQVGQEMTNWNNTGTSPDYTIHLGDVYYAGTLEEVEENCLNGADAVPPDLSGDCVQWPHGKIGSFALNGNHEMYSLGYAYFDKFLPTLGLATTRGQGPSFFSLENQNWRIVAIDTGYNSISVPVIEEIILADCALRQENLNWLKDTIASDTSKTTIVFSHHQYFTNFEKEEEYHVPADQLADILGSTPIIWFWGHEHRLSGYKLGGPGKLQVYGRCLGHGGMPIEIGTIQNPPPQNNPALLFHDARVSPVNKPLGINGFVELEFSGPTLTVRYISVIYYPTGISSLPNYPSREVLLTETFTRDGNGGIAQVITGQTNNPSFRCTP